jgi:asparagine synthase (glutamine-hydrolysing)
VLDGAAAAYSVEPRYPFFDRRLVEFCLSLPGDQKLSGGWTRAVMRRALEGILPDEVRWRSSKGNLAPNFDRALLKFGQNLMDDVILNDPSVIEEYVNVPTLRQAYKRYARRETDGDAFDIWMSITLALWLRQTRLDP